MKVSRWPMSVRKAYDQGIHVIVLDRELEGDDWTCFIGANNRDIRPLQENFLSSIWEKTDIPN